MSVAKKKFRFPREIWSLIFEFDPTFRSLFSRSILDTLSEQVQKRLHRQLYDYVVCPWMIAHAVLDPINAVHATNAAKDLHPAHRTLAWEDIFVEKVTERRIVRGGAFDPDTPHPCALRSLVFHLATTRGRGLDLRLTMEMPDEAISTQYARVFMYITRPVPAGMNTI
jgi:hypothetical protein